MDGLGFGFDHEVVFSVVVLCRCATYLSCSCLEVVQLFLMEPPFLGVEVCPKMLRLLRFGTLGLKLGLDHSLIGKRSDPFEGLG